MQQLRHSPSNILIVRVSAIGDIVMASPLPAALKTLYPKARISWLCQPECAPLVLDHPNIDQVLTWDRKNWETLWRQKKLFALGAEVSRFRQHLRQQDFDLAIDLQGLLKSGLLTLMSGASTRIGLGSSEGSQLFMHHIVSRSGGNQDVISSEYRFLAHQLGYASAEFDMQVGISSASETRAQNLVNDVTGNTFFVICPFTTRPQKHWFNDYWTEVAQSLRDEHGIPVVLLGGPADVDAARILCDGSDIVNLAGKTSLQEAAALIKKSSGVIGVDTGLTHVGHAMKVPTLALFGSTRPYLDANAEKSQVLYLNLHCAPCKRSPTCDGRFDCLREITPKMVIEQFSRLSCRP